MKLQQAREVPPPSLAVRRDGAEGIWAPFGSEKEPGTLGWQVVSVLRECLEASSSGPP